MKKFGKLRQWTDEKLGSSQKTIATEEFRDMEAEMHLRQQGLENVHQASVTWMKFLGKQIRTDNQEKEKGTPLDLLGIAMFQHGDDFAPESAYGQAMSRFGISQQKIARIQDKFQVTVHETVLLNMERSLAAMKDFQTARKKLESRRLTYDSALSKTQKAKKEDSKLEEELRAAKVRYEESSEDVHQRMLSIREAEANNLRDILDFIEAEFDYFEEARSVVDQLRDELRIERTTRNGQTLHRQLSSASILGRTAVTKVQDDLQGFAESSCVSARALPREMKDELIQRNRKALLPARRSLNSYDRAYNINEAPRQPPQTGSLASREVLDAASCEELSVRQARSGRKVMLVNFSFDAEAETELTIRAGECLEVLEEVSAGWWRGQIIKGSIRDQTRIGLFPVNYCSEHNEAVLDDEECKFMDKSGIPCSTSWTNDHPTDKSMTHKSHTFPRTVRQVSAAYGLNAQNTSMRPPPPPIPKKKVSLRDTNSPGRKNMGGY
ncbi:BAR domain protein [Taphrina deformans PYCC 5710]|uniref:BAR domain protein n=1 Tax=Taphrina deformans (strain PYCC 5710 / ATCC 11124 / CBS 356.35 / IMI 108563 / JCM 9778 / NBRC 8474) TaxID=1097556 RepID=R4XBK1_TAPDE|nr:BAR domain protein [Taphrina deformans PYCC 5710]|eukprot:CCG81751.1 BAR domain protein [Taphrina deformans PYCC 5710]